MARRIEPTPAVIEAVAGHLRSGGVVALPTETVYGLGACAFSESAVHRIYTLKGRPADNPLIVHVADTGAALQIAGTLTAVQRSAVERCARACWPGPLTLVLPRHPSLPAIVSAGRATVAVRCPRHPVAQALLRGTGEPVAAPSANRSGGVSPTEAAHVLADFSDVPDLIVLDGGACEIGLESTVLDLSTDPPRILRPGTVSEEMLKALVPGVEAPRIAVQDASPGTAMRHYAPATPVRVVPAPHVCAVAEATGGLCAIIARSGDDVGDASPLHLRFTMPDDAAGYAARLYAVLRDADQAGARCIIVAAPPVKGALWHAVHDRLSRAAAPG